jgi:hypothetical protein
MTAARVGKILEVTMGFAPMHSGFADRRVNCFAT